MKNAEKTEVYLDNLRHMYHKYFIIMRDYYVFAVEVQTYLRGYAYAGRTLGIFTKESLEKLIDVEHTKVFGMNVKDRKKKHKARKVYIDDPKYLEIPAVERMTVNIW